jgi:hypothetical protein
VSFALAGLAAASIPVVAAAQKVNITMRAWTQPIQMDTLRQDHHLNASAEKVYDAALKTPRSRRSRSSTFRPDKPTGSAVSSAASDSSARAS